MQAGSVFVLWCMLLLGYLVLAGSTSANEIGAGALVCLLVAGIVRAVRRGSHRTLRNRIPVRVLGATLLSLPTDTIRVAERLLQGIARRPEGRVGPVKTIPFRSGADRPKDSGRRAVVTLAASLAPNGFVLAVPQGRDTLVMHQLVPTRPPADRDWPV